MARRIAVPINLGRMDRVAPKHAPFGVLRRVENMRHREVGGFGMRNGYQPLAMTTPAASLVAYDLHEYNGRLLALGSSTTDGYPSDLWEYTGVVNQGGGVWRQGDPSAPRTPIGPFTNMRQVGGIPHPEGGVSFIDGAAGAGYVCLSYRTASGTGCNVLIVRQSDDQAISFIRAGNGGLPSNALSGRVIFAAGKFLFMYADTSTNAINILQYTPGSSTSWTSFAAVDGASGNAVSAMDLVAIGNPTTAAVVAAFDRGPGATNLDIKAYSSAGAQVGSTISVAGTTTSTLALEADQTANQIVLLAREPSNLVLRTFNFAGALVAGPTNTTLGNGQLTRVRFTQTGTPAVAAVINNGTNGVTIEQYNPATHALNYSQVVQSAKLQTRVIDSSSPGSSTLDTVSFGALIGPLISLGNITTDVTNALFTCSRSGGFQHVRRNYLNAKSVGAAFGLSLDASTSRVLWVAGEDDGSELVMPSLALLDFKSQARRQSAQFGGLLYLSGATPLVYDGRILVEPGFDLPGVLSATPSNGAGALTPGATYSYQVHFEFTLSDGSIIQGPPSSLLSVTLGPSDDTVTVVVQTPHCIAVSLGGAMYGADVTAVLSRTEWSPNTINPTTGLAGAQLSILRRAKTQAVPTGATVYGATLSIVDTISDASLATQGAIYTQSERGALSGTLEHNLPQACSFVTTTEGRVLSGGLFRGYEFQVSKEAFLGSVFGWSEFSSFFGTVSDLVRGVQALDGARFVFTSKEIFALEQGDPDDLGQGALGRPLRVPTPSGLKDWRSLLEGPDGLWFQLDDDKIFRIPRGGGSPEWLAQDIVDLLAAYPNCTAAARHRKDNCALFALGNAAGNDARIAVRDFERETWLVDVPPLQASSDVDAMVVLDRTTAYVSGGVVYVQSASSFADNTSAPIVCLLETQPIYPFELGGYGVTHDLMITAEYRGDCTLAVRVSLDDGISYTALPSFVISGLTSGATVRRKWALPNNNTTSVLVEVTVTPSGVTEGLIINEIDLLAEETPGALPELLPAEMA